MSDLLDRLEAETHRNGMWADTCLLLDEAAAALRRAEAARDEHLDARRYPSRSGGRQVSDLRERAITALSGACFPDNEAREQTIAQVESALRDVRAATKA